MKTKALIALFIGLTLGACTTQKQPLSYSNDEVYLPSSSRQQKSTVSASQPVTKGTEIITSPDGVTTSPPPSSTFESDYNDYSYSNRIKRFSSSDTAKGYFDETYAPEGSNAGNSGGGSPNISFSIGIGAGFGGYYNYYDPFWGSPYYGWGLSFGWGYPYYGWGYPYYGWGYPYYGWGYPYYGYYPPYYYPCCYECYYGYPPVYASGSYYGPRNSPYRSDGGTTQPNDRMVNQQTAVQQPNDRNTMIPPNTRSTDQAGASAAVTPSARSSAQNTYRYTRPAQERSAPSQRVTPETTRSTGAVRSQSLPRYTRPEDAVSRRSEPTQSYSSPVYRQPKTSREYLAPRSQSQNAVRSGSSIDNSNSRSSGFTSPVRSGNQVAPVRSGNNSYSAPRQNSGGSNYSAPVRSGNNSYSAPTRSSSSGSSSGGSYSAPTRSSGSSGSSPSSGGSSGRRK